MQKSYERINWENYPSDKTPLNEANLNKLDVATDEIDNRVITLDSTKFDKTEASKLIKNFELDKATGIITITYLSGATVTIDTLLEKLAVNFGFDEATQKIIITLDDGTVKEVDLSSFITDYEFLDSDTVAFTVDANGKVVAIVKEGSIEEKHLRPNYLADIKVEVAKAEASAIRAEQAEINAVASADNATQFVDEALRQLEAGELKGDRGSVIHSGVRVYLATGSNPVGIISNFTDNVLVGDYYINTNNGDYFICTKVENNKSYWDFLINLKGIEGKRGSKIYIAEDDVFFPPQNIQSQAYTGDVIINSTTGDMYEVTSDSHTAGNIFDFKLVGNIKGPEGDVGESAVTGVKGNAESDYSTGLYNITPEKIGAMPSTKLTSSVDFNTLTTTGFYHINFTDGDNKPTTNHGTLIVDFSVGTPYQIWIPDNRNVMYKRYYTTSNTTWSKWTVMDARNADYATKAMQDGNGNVIANTYLPYGGYYSNSETSINDIITPGIHRMWVGVSSDDGKYLKLYQSEQLAIIVTKESGLIKQYIVGFGGSGTTSNIMYWRSTNSQTDLTFTYDTPLQTLCYTFTPDAGDNSNRIATTEWVNNLVQNSAITVSSYPYNGITDLLKFPIGTYRFGSNSVINQYANTPNKAGILQVESIDPSKSPWKHSYGYRQYTFHTYQNDLYIRVTDSGASAGVINHDTGWVKITTNSQILNTATAIEASTSNENIVGVQGLKEYVGKANKVYTASPSSLGIAEVSVDASQYSHFVAVNVVVGSAGNKGIGRMVFAKNGDAWYYKSTASTYTGNANELTSSTTAMYNNLVKISCSAGVSIACSIESGF